MALLLGSSFFFAPAEPIAQEVRFVYAFRSQRTASFLWIPIRNTPLPTKRNKEACLGFFQKRHPPPFYYLPFFLYFPPRLADQQRLPLEHMTHFGIHNCVFIFSSTQRSNLVWFLREKKSDKWWMAPRGVSYGSDLKARNDGFREFPAMRVPGPWFTNQPPIFKDPHPGKKNEAIFEVPVAGELAFVCGRYLHFYPRSPVE